MSLCENVVHAMITDGRFYSFSHSYDRLPSAYPCKAEYFCPSISKNCSKLFKMLIYWKIYRAFGHGFSKVDETNESEPDWDETHCLRLSVREFGFFETLTWWRTEISCDRFYKILFMNANDGFALNNLEFSNTIVAWYFFPPQKLLEKIHLTSLRTFRKFKCLICTP